MDDQTPGLPAPKGGLSVFDPVPRKRPRHDGWTPERQRAFVAALADTGCVSVAARMVNMSQESAYLLRRQPGAESFRHAWEAAQGLGLQVVKDEAFDRAMHGQLVPVFVGGKLMGFRRKKNDRLLMFILRHYGQDATGRRTTINYFSTKATAAAGAAAPSALHDDRRAVAAAATAPLPSGEREGPAAKRWEGEGAAGETRSADAQSSPALSGDGGPETRSAALAAAEASAATVRTVLTGDGAPSRLAAQDEAAALLDAFAGVDLDAEAQAGILQVLEAAAGRRRAADPDRYDPGDRLAVQAADPECDFIRVRPGSVEYAGELESGATSGEFVPLSEGEWSWESLGAPVPQWFTDWEQRQAEAEAARALPPPDSPPPSVRPEPAEGPPPHASEPIPEPSNPQSQIPNPQPAEATPDPACPGPRSGDPGPTKTRKRSPEPGRRTYKPRKPKPPFTPPGQAAEVAAREEAETARRTAAQAEAVRRERRRKEAKGE